MKDELLYTSDPNLIRQYIKDGHKVVSIGYFLNNENPLYKFTFKKKKSKNE